MIIDISTVAIVKPINFEPWREIYRFNYQDCRNIDNQLLTMQNFISLIHAIIKIVLFWAKNCENWNSAKCCWRFPRTDVIETTKRHLNASGMKRWLRTFSSIVYASNLDKITQKLLLQVGVKFILFYCSKYYIQKFQHFIMAASLSYGISQSSAENNFYHTLIINLF